MVLLLAGVSCASAAELGIGAAQIAGAGATVTVPITLDEAPEGLSGYVLTVQIANPAVAGIVAVDFPPWASIHGTSELPAGRVSMRAADLSEQVHRADTGIPLATLTLKGMAAGSTTLGITVDQVDDDEGNLMALASPEVPLIVGSSGSGGDDSSGSGGGSGGPAAPGADSGAPAGSPASSGGSAAPIQAGGRGAGDTPPAQPADGQPAGSGASVSISPSPLPSGGADGGIPGYVLGLLLIAAIAVGIGVFIRRRAR